MATRYLRRHEAAADRIIKSEGLTFALASMAGNPGDLRDARDNLKVAICVALSNELAHGAELQRRSMEDNKLMASSQQS